MSAMAIFRQLPPIPKYDIIVILTRVMNIRLLPCIFVVLTLGVQFSAEPSSAQTVPSRDQWGEKFNSPGAKLSYKEIGRDAIQGRTVITYNLFASGLPK